MLTSCRSCTDGMSHSNDLSNRPGRSSAGSMRSGRLSGTTISNLHALQSIFRAVPCGSQNINAIQAFCSIHLGEQLIDHSIGHPSAIMTSANKLGNQHAQTRSDHEIHTYRLGAIESNSSKNSTQGFAADALANISRICRRHHSANCYT